MPSAPAGCQPRSTAADKEQPQNRPQQCWGRGRVGEAQLVSFTLLTAGGKGTECSLQDRDSSPFQSQLAWRCLTPHKSGKCCAWLQSCPSPAVPSQSPAEQRAFQLQQQCSSSRLSWHSSFGTSLYSTPLSPRRAHQG